MFSMTYTSEGQHAFDEPELAYLLQRSREWNQGHGLSGLLLYKAGSFMQAIEGDEKTVLKTFRRRIKRDSRHANIRVLNAGEISARQFPDWTMGYRRVATESEPDVAGYDDFLTRGDFGPSWSSPTPARVLLDWFRLYAGATTNSPPVSPYQVR
jgi:hypothetical protein